MHHNILNDLSRTAREKPEKLAFSDGVTGLTFRELARITGTPLGTVLWRYRKAIEKLRILLNGGSV